MVMVEHGEIFVKVGKRQKRQTLSRTEQAHLSSCQTHTVANIYPKKEKNETNTPTASIFVDCKKKRVFSFTKTLHQMRENNEEFCGNTHSSYLFVHICRGPFHRNKKIRIYYSGTEVECSIYPGGFFGRGKYRIPIVSNGFVAWKEKNQDRHGKDQ